MNFNGRAQSSLEYMIIIGAGLAILAVFIAYSFIYSSSYTNYQTSQSTSLSVQTISQEANYILTQSLGSSITFSLPLQSLGVPASFFCGKYFVFSTNTTESLGYANSNIISTIPLSSGTYQATAKVYEIDGLTTAYIKFNLPVSYINYSYFLNSTQLTYNFSLYTLSGKKSTVNTPYTVAVYTMNKSLLGKTTTLIVINGSARGNVSVSSAHQQVLVVIYLPDYKVASSTCFPYGQLSLPQNVINYAAVSINNSQNNATENPFQQMINLSLSSFGSYINETANYFGQNVEFFYANGSIVPSWLEYYNITKGYAIWWLKLGSIPAKSVDTIYIGFASKTNNLFSMSNDVGESPALSSIYGQYDDGADVFEYYFNGSSSAGWAIHGTSGETATAPAGSPFGTNALFANSAGGDYMNTSLSAFSSVSNYIIEYYVYTTGLGNLFFVASSSGGGVMSRLDSRGGGNYIGLAKTASWSSWYCPESGVTALPDTWYLQSDVITANGKGIGSYIGPGSNNINNLGSTVNSNSTTYTDGCGGGIETFNEIGNYIGLVGDGLGSSYITYWNGIIIRAYPPNGMMPFSSFGAIQG